MEITIAKTGDAQSIFRIFNDARAAMTYLPAIHTDQETEVFIRSLVASGTVSLASVDGRAAGFMQVADGWLHHLYVAPNAQRQGIGNRLLGAAKSLQPAGIQLWVFEQNTDAIRFYEREGFVLVEQRDQEAAINEENLPDRRYTWHGSARGN